MAWLKAWRSPLDGQSLKRSGLPLKTADLLRTSPSRSSAINSCPRSWTTC